MGKKPRSPRGRGNLLSDPDSHSHSHRSTSARGAGNTSKLPTQRRRSQNLPCPLRNLQPRTAVTSRGMAGFWTTKQLVRIKSVICTRDECAWRRAEWTGNDRGEWKTLASRLERERVLEAGRGGNSGERMQSSLVCVDKGQLLFC